MGQAAFGTSITTTVLCATATWAACGSTGPYRVSVPAPADGNAVFFCVVAELNQLGYRLDRRDRAMGRIEGRGTVRRGWTSTREPIYDDITVFLAHEPSGDVLRVTSSDRGHAERVATRCGAGRR
ncbi:MAG TPA: hypothetical protein VNL18_09850 [Gemmatimonadales bacterium]|nr:hypothetical protein [Gemmatimonadales bacterium]